jgi:hypothetical protein
MTFLQFQIEENPNVVGGVLEQNAVHQKAINNISTQQHSTKDFPQLVRLGKL